MLKHEREGKNAVSPIIGTVLLLGITVVFASVMFLWISSFSYERSLTPAAGMFAEKNNTAPSVNYTITFTITFTAFRPSTDPEDVECYICDEKGKLSGHFSFSSPSSTSINGRITGEAEWKDTDGNSYFSAYDEISINITNGKEYANSFALRYNPAGGELIGEVML